MTAILYIGSVEALAGLWISAYYAGWMQRYLPAQEVDFTAMTHVIHFAVVPRTDGTLDSDVNAVTSANSTDVITRAHAAGVKVLISVGGENSAIGFRGATSSANRTRFVTNIVSFVAARGYDGVDLDWEPLDSSDAAPYASLVNELRAALDAITPRRLLTAAVGSQPALLASLQTKFDQINLMTYSYSGAWPGWVTWFNAPVYDGGYRFPTTGRLMPSADGSVSNFLAAGVAADKLGIGICFYGCNWSGGAGTSTGGAALPRQTWKTPPTVTTLTYSAIVSTYYQPQLYRWDTNAQSAYLSLDQPGSTNDLFISYDDQTACRAKLAYAKRKGLGGLIIWELGGGYRADAPNGQRDILLQSIKQAVATQTAHSATGADELATPQDPHKLLESVTQARQRITSGKMEFDVFTYSFDHPLDGTNQVNLKVVFDGTRRRFEQSGREYRYVFMGPDADKVTDAKRQELGLDKEAAVRAGLLTGFESHYVTVYDGAVLMEYWETDGKPFQTKIDDPAEGSGTYLFDPRVLGLTPSPSVSDTIGSCLTHNYADSIRLMGKESVEGSEAWHVRASYAKPGPNFDYWID
ncbi:MAG TPA: glycoside hydrolase family 18 protein, partial [Verrucomicrobiae bacterium]|nr:glycoside hydrolase family 18 protein [Verrucomicrobiae bacterium]